MSEPLKVGFVPASRAMFDQQLAVSVRGACIEAMRAAGIEPVVPGPELTKNGLVQGVEDARKAARLFDDESVEGVVIGALNFGDEIPAAIAAAHGAPPVPVMLFGIGEEGELRRQGARRDAFCGLISIATALRHRRRFP
jgi:L-fucose isomerase-like protein